jgi:hypothetical protein
MPITITVKDETAGGRIITETPIILESELTHRPGHRLALNMSQICIKL